MSVLNLAIGEDQQLRITSLLVYTQLLDLAMHLHLTTILENVLLDIKEFYVLIDKLDLAEQTIINEINIKIQHGISLGYS